MKQFSLSFVLLLLSEDTLRCCVAWTPQQTLTTKRRSSSTNKNNSFRILTGPQTRHFHLQAWNGAGSYLDNLNTPQQQQQQESDYPNDVSYQNYHSQQHQSNSDEFHSEASHYDDAYSFSTDTTNNNGSSVGWSSSAWQEQYDAFTKDSGATTEQVVTEIKTNAALNEAIEKHSSYWFGQGGVEGLKESKSEPIIDWSSKADEIAKRIEMASQYSFGNEQQPAQSEGPADWSVNHSEYVEDPRKGETLFLERPQFSEEPRHIVSHQSPPSEPEPSAVDIEQQLDDFEERALRILSTEVGYKKLLGQNPYAWTDAPVGVAISRGIDTIEDAIIHMRRLPYKLGFGDLPDESAPDRPTVVVLGTGWGAHAFVKVACTFDLKIVVVSPVNHFVRWIDFWSHLIHLQPTLS